MRRIVALRAGTALLGVALVLVAPAQAQSPSLVESVPSITVEGLARREVVPDLAVATLGVETTRPDAAAAAGDNAKAAAQIVATARQSGVAGFDIATSELRMAGVTDGRDASRIKAFRVSNHVTLKVRDLARLPALLGGLLAQGVNAIEGIDFTLEDPRPLLDELRAKATQDAVDKARIYAKAAGVTLGRILRIAPEAGSPMPMPRAYKLQMAEAAPAPPVEAGTQTLESRVQITWELVP